MKKLLSITLALTLILGLAPAVAAEAVTPTPPSWCPEEEYAVFSGSAAYEPENWGYILALRQAVSGGPIDVSALPKDVSRGYSKLYDLATDYKAPDVGVLFELALVETRLLYTHDGETKPHWTNLTYQFDKVWRDLDKEQLYLVLLWNARGALRYFGWGEEAKQHVILLLKQSDFSVSTLLNTPIFTQEEQAQWSRAIDPEQLMGELLSTTQFRLEGWDELAWTQDKILVVVDEMLVAIADSSTVREQRVMVPIRAVAEAIGGDVEWVQDKQQVVMTRAGSTVTMTLNSTTATIDGKTVEMDVAPYAVDGRTLLPARYVAEFFGQKVEWDGEKRQVLITEDKSVADGSNLEQWALAMGLIYTYRAYTGEGTPTNIRFGMSRRLAKHVQARRESLSANWGGNDRAHIIGLVQSMTAHGHNDSFQAAAKDANALTPNELTYLVSISGEVDQYMWPYTKSLSEKWGDRGILAWDLSRMGAMVQWGYHAGCLTYEEALALVEPAAQLAVENFSSWEEFYENYLDGYNWWARNNVVGMDPWETERGPLCRKMLEDPILDDTLFQTGVIPLPEQDG